MSIRTGRESVDRVFPCLAKLKENYQAYTNLLKLMEQATVERESQMDGALQDMLQFEEAVQQSVFADKDVVSQLITELSQLRTQASSAVKPIQPTHSRRRSLQPSKNNKTINQQIQSRLHIKSNEESETHSQTQNIQSEKHKRGNYFYYTSAQARQAKQLLSRNQRFCQAHLRLAAFNRKPFAYPNLFNHYVCSLCQTVCRKARFSNQIGQHYETVHNVKFKNSKRGKLYNTYEVYDMMKVKIENNQLALYRCNCTSALMNSEHQYVEHIETKHHGQVPPFSSHLIQKKGGTTHVEVNSEFEQMCVLEDILMPEFYYCGTCQASFEFHAPNYCKHLIDNHDGINQPNSSHFLRTAKIEQRKAKKKKQLSDCYDVSCLRWVLDQYKGPFFCQHCDIKFASYSLMVAHFQARQAKNEPYLHNRYWTGFIKVGINRRPNGNYIEVFFLPVKPLTAEIENYMLSVPIPTKGRHIEHEAMTYKKFIDRVCKFQYHKLQYVCGWQV